MKDKFVKKRGVSNSPEKGSRVRTSKSILFNSVYLFAFLVSLFANKGLAQVTTNVSQPYPLGFATGVGVTGGATTLVPIGGNDPNWQVSTSMGSGPSAIVINPPSQPSSCTSWANNSNNPNQQWITAPSATCGSVWGNTSCNSITDLYFSTSVSLPVNPVFRIDAAIWASDYVKEIILVNSSGTQVIWTTGPGAPPMHRWQALQFSWCTFQAGVNKIYVHVQRDAGQTVSSCQVLGMKVECWAQYLTSSISGPTLACHGSSYGYSFPSPSSFAINPMTTPFTYAWAAPYALTPTWGITGTNSAVTALAGTNSGIMSAAFYTIGPGPMYNKYCMGVGGYSITVPPTLTLSVPSPTLCSGSSMNVVATPGASLYTFIAPPHSTVYNGPTNNISITPGVGNKTYTVIAKNGCTYKKTFNVTTYQTPTVSVTSNTPAICKGQCATLTIVGSGNQFSITPCWQPNPCTIFTWSPMAFCPTVTTNYTVITNFAPWGCKGYATVLVTVNNIPTLTAVANPSVVCAGQNANVVLTAGGATTYTWASVPMPNNVNPKTVAVNTPTTFTVTGANGLCSSTKTVFVATIAAPVIVVNPPQICVGIPNVLTATGGNNYTWNFSAGTSFTTAGNSATIVSSSATNYTVCGTGANACSSCTSGVISLGAPIPLTVPDVTLCTSAGPCTTISATSSYTGPITYTWTSGPAPSTGSVVTVCPTTPTVYIVSASSTVAGCPNTATMAVALASNCCSQPTTGLTQLSGALGGNYFNTSYFLNSSITLTNTSFFKNSDIWITEGVNITVPATTQLQLENAHFFACANKMWQGIVVQDKGSIATVNTRTVMSMIEDAMVAIDLDNISLTNASPNLPIDISRLIFNRNYIGIKISNSVPTLTSLPLGINGCLFTSRNLPYTTYPSTVSVPNNDNSSTPGALRAPTGPTTSIIPPYGYLANNFGQAFLKMPYASQPAHIGIQIINIGNPSAPGFSTNINTGVEFGITYTGAISNDFNLFENIGHGIDVVDACLTIKNNVFQNLQRYSTSSGVFGGKGINHTISSGSQRFTRLDLRNGGNHFWDCHVGVNAVNVYETWITDAVFRSTHMIGTAWVSLTNAQGDIGVYHESDQSNFTVQQCEFNNLKRGIISRPGTNYNLVHGLLLRYNYFGPEVTSNTPYTGAIANTTEYMDIAIDVETPAGNFPPGSGGWLIMSNKINRVFRGINFDGFGDPGMLMASNEILIEEDLTYNLNQYGISVQNNLGNMSVSANTVNAVVHWNSTFNSTNTAIYFQNNYGTGSPFISCNEVMNTGYGFQFEGSNSSSIWQGNNMCNNKYGLGLTNGGVMGIQGSTAQSNNNRWLIPATSNNVCNNWNGFSADKHTYTYFSNPQLSAIYVNSSGSIPTLNLSTPPGNQYQFAMPSSLYNASSQLNDCIYNGTTAPPSWRAANLADVNGTEEDFIEENVQIFPNPTNGVVTVKCGSKLFSVVIYDISGKKVLEQKVLQATDISIDLSELAPSIYFMEVKNEAGKMLMKKLIKTE